MCRLLKGDTIAAGILGKVAESVVQLAKDGRRPRLVSLTIGGSAAADVYVRNQRRVAASVGIDFVEAKLDDDTTECDALSAIGRLNDDASTTGIIVQRPVPTQVSIQRRQFMPWLY